MKNFLKVLSQLGRVSQAVATLNAVSNLAPGNPKITRALTAVEKELDRLNAVIGIIRLTAQTPRDEDL